jgi:hypothetical protein
MHDGSNGSANDRCADSGTDNKRSNGRAIDRCADSGWGRMYRYGGMDE